MDDLNQVAIAGRLTRDPQLRMTRNGTPICNLRIACNKMFFNIKVWGEQGQQVAGSASKGDVVHIEGRLDWYEWSPGDGPRREFVGVVANDTPGAVRLISSPNGPGIGGGQSFTSQPSQNFTSQGGQSFTSQPAEMPAMPLQDLTTPTQNATGDLAFAHQPFADAPSIGDPLVAPAMEQTESPFATEDFGRADAVALPAEAVTPVATSIDQPAVGQPFAAQAPSVGAPAVAQDAAVTDEIKSVEAEAVEIAPPAAAPGAVEEPHIEQFAAGEDHAGFGGVSDSSEVIEADSRFI